MNNKARFLNLFRETLLKARNDHSELLESIPINKGRQEAEYYARYTSYGFQFRFPFEGTEAHTKDELRNKIREIGESVVSTVLIAFKDEITVDLKGHNHSKEQTCLLAESNNRDEITVNSICRVLGFNVGVQVLNLPKTLDPEFDTKGIFESIYDIFDFCNEDGMKLTSDSFSSCGCCGDSLKPLLDINTFEITLHATFDNKSNSPLATLKPRDCPFPDGVGSYSNKISTPSKKVIIANDFRSILAKVDMENDDYIESKFNSYNTISTSQAANVYNTEYYAKYHNMMYVQCGDGGVSLFQDKDTLNIEAKSEYFYNQETGEEIENFSSNETLIGDVDFRLWAMCAMDYDQFVELCKQKDDSMSIEDWIDELDATVAGTNRDSMTFTSHYFAQNSRNEALVGIA